MYLNIIQYAIAEGLSRLAPFLASFFLASKMSVNDFGFVSLFLVIYEILFIVISNNIQATTKIDFFKMNDNEFFSLKKSHFVNGLFLIIPSFVIIYFYFDYPFYIVSSLVVFSFVRSYISYILTMLQCKKLVNDYMLISAVYVIVFFIVLYLSISLGVKAWFISIGVAYIIQLTFVYWKYKHQPFVLFNVGIVKKSFMYSSLYSGLLFMPQAIGWWMKTGVDRFLVNEFFGVGSLASFSLGFQFSALVVMGVIAVNLAIVPELNLMLKNRDIRGVNKILLVGCAAVLFGSTVVFFIGNYAIEYYYSYKFDLAKEIFPLFMLSIIPQGLVLILTNVLYFSGHKVFVAKSVFFCSLMQVLVNCLFVEYLGLYGLIYSSIFFNVILLAFVFMKTKYTVKGLV